MGYEEQTVSSEFMTAADEMVHLCTEAACVDSHGGANSERRKDVSNKEKRTKTPQCADLSFGTWNANGLSFGIVDYIDSLHYDVFCFSETHGQHLEFSSQQHICCGIVPDSDRYAGVALRLSRRAAAAVIETSPSTGEGSHPRLWGLQRKRRAAPRPEVIARRRGRTGGGTGADVPLG